MSGENSRGQTVQPPEGVRLVVGESGAQVSARAGSVGLRVVAALAIAVIWAAKWGLDLARLIVAVRAGTAENPGPGLFIFSVAALAGFYCAALFLWTMVGHETLSIRKAKLLLGNPWLFGLVKRRFPLDKVGSFECAGKDCGLQAEADSCCCRWSAEDYLLTFGYGGRRVPVFTHLPREAKDWLRDRLNEFLKTG